MRKGRHQLVNQHRIPISSTEHAQESLLGREERTPPLPHDRLRSGAFLWLVALPWAVAFGSLAAIHLGNVAVTPADGLVAVGTIVLLLGGSRRSRCGMGHALNGQPWWRRVWWVLGGGPLAALRLVVIILLLWMMVSLGWAHDRGAGLKEIAKWSEALAILCLAPRLLRQPRHAVALVLAIATAAAAEAVIGALQATMLAPHLAAAVPDRGLRVIGTFGQPNPYAGYLNLALPFAVAYGFWGASRYWRGMAGTTALALLAGLALADSRGALVGVTVAVIVMAAAGWPRTRRAIALASGAAMAIALALWRFGGTAIHLRLDAAGWRPLDDASLSRAITDGNFSTLERLAHWAAAMRMFQTRPLSGVGIGNYADRYLAFAVPAWPRALGHAHNVYLNLAAELGISGLILALLFASTTLWLGWWAVQRTAGEGRALALGALGVAVGVAVHQIFDDLTTHNMLIQFALILALAASLPLIWPAKGRSMNA